MKTQSFTVLIHKEEDIHIAECPEVGTVDQGKSIEQAIAGLKEATRLYLEGFLYSQYPNFLTSHFIKYSDRNLFYSNSLYGNRSNIFNGICFL
jgi:predicted RNase H-like HicB family nuclease